MNAALIVAAKPQVKTQNQRHTYQLKYMILNYFDKVDVYCEEPPGLFFLYVPIPFFALLIILCDFRVSMKYLKT